MKTKRFFPIFLSIVCVIALSIPAYAMESKESSQIAVYTMNATADPGKISVFFSVTGAGVVNKLGCESIYIYELVDSKWTLIPAQTKLENDDGMSQSNTYGHTNTIYCDSDRNVAYKVVVTIFAENAKGRDTRSKTFYVTGKQATTY